MKIGNQFVIVFSHTRYISHGGTQKVVGNIIKNYNRINIDVIQIFPVNKLGENVGVNINEKFWGIMKLKNVQHLLDYLSCRGKECLGIILAHTMNYNLYSLGNLLKATKLDIILAIHDFYLVCNSFDMQKNHNKFCGFESPSEKKCLDCHNYVREEKFIKERNYFLEEINSQIIKVVFPSEFCMKKWIVFFPQFSNRCIIRPNANILGNYKKKNYNSKIKIAYLGILQKYKGSELWKKICENKNIKKEFELFYFGVDTNLNIDSINKVFVDGERNNAIEELRKNNIDIVLLLSKVPETYSFTYYEASCANCMIITIQDAGNIAKQVEQNGNGIVLDREEDVISLLENSKKMKNIYKEFIIKNTYLPSIIEANENIECFLFNKRTINNKKRISLINRIKPKNNICLTMAYRLKNKL